MRYYHFGISSPNPEKVNYYISNFDLLEAFILYFHEKAEQLLSRSDKIIIPELNLDVPLERIEENISHEDRDRELFLNEIQYDHIKFDAVPTKKPFTLRERRTVYMRVETQWLRYRS